MIESELRKLVGKQVRWDNEPGLGTVIKTGGRTYVLWPDNQTTESTDDWALLHVMEATDAPLS